MGCGGEAGSPSSSAATGGSAASNVGGADSGGSVARAGGSAAGTSTVDGDPEPALSEADLALLRALAPQSLPAARADVSNKWADDEQAAIFGQRLFFDARFAGALLDGDNDGSVNALGRKGETGKVACSGCHVPERGFSDTRTIRQQVSLGSGWGLRRAPSLLDVGQSPVLMWDGRHDSLMSQVFGPLESEVEMNSSRLFAAQQIFANHQREYEAIFGALPPLSDASRFPPLSAAQTGCSRLDKDSHCVDAKRGSPGDGAEFDGMATGDQDSVTRVWVNAGKAMGAYQRRLTCGASRFDDFMQGDQAALSRAEQRGAALFVGKAKCIDCHSGPYLSDEKFHNVGLQPQVVSTVFIDANDPGASVGLSLAQTDPLSVAGPYSDGDDGRMPEQLGPELLGAFRTPRLRCVAGRPSFMHTAQLLGLEQVVEFFDRGGDSFGFPGKSELQPLNLTARERADLVAFLGSLTGPGPEPSLLGPP
ncbi:MAG TPA: cytochrome c peroxidase [Polyangiaceae bacterium]|nr:cytochrome c peroxidase [Polyangiaceae bacterium]